jgi:hypothetical protein
MSPPVLIAWRPTFFTRSPNSCSDCEGTSEEPVVPRHWKLVWLPQLPENPMNGSVRYCEDPAM